MKIFHRISLYHLHFSGISVVSGDVGTWTDHGLPAETFAVSKLLTWSKPEEFAQNYWLAPDRGTGQFVLDLGNTVTVRNIFLVNTHNGVAKDRGTKDFKVFLGFGATGPWMQVLKQTLPDSRNLEPVPPRTYEITPTFARYVKFELLSYWGYGGGLQFFTVNEKTIGKSESNFI